MTECTVVVRNRNGLHARPASAIVKVAAAFECDIVLIREGMNVNAKSIMGVMMLAAEPGAELIVRATGRDEEAATAALAQLFDSGFGEH